MSGASEGHRDPSGSNSSAQVRGGFHFPEVIIKSVKKEMG